MLEPKPKWVKILLDNGGHYHCAELMSMITNWNSWYGIEVRSWTFLEAGEAKTTVDSHHAQIAHAIKRYVRLGYSINEGEDIETAIKDIRGTTVTTLNQIEKISTRISLNFLESPIGINLNIR